jgi:hypothetical protein
MENRDPDRREDESTPDDRRREQQEKERSKRRPRRWSRDVEVTRSVNAAVQDADFDDR